MADDPKPVTTPKTARFIRAKDFRVAFANTFRFRTGAADIGIAFGYQTEVPGPTPDSSQNIIQDEVEVVLTPVMLKLMQMAIADNIEAIETATGSPIELPQTILDALAEQKAKLTAELAAELKSAPKNE
ncbi:MAG: hypothetical protein ABSC37_02105 [Xanthobacteraceae bacterium]|jgi:hypothetical protein